MNLPISPSSKVSSRGDEVFIYQFVLTLTSRLTAPDWWPQWSEGEEIDNNWRSVIMTTLYPLIVSCIHGWHFCDSKEVCFPSSRTIRAAVDNWVVTHFNLWEIEISRQNKIEKWRIMHETTFLVSEAELKWGIINTMKYEEYDFKGRHMKNAGREEPWGCRERRTKLWGQGGISSILLSVIITACEVKTTFCTILTIVWLCSILLTWLLPAQLETSHHVHFPNTLGLFPMSG